MFPLNGTSRAFESQVYSQLRSRTEREGPAGERSPADDQRAEVKWSSNSLVKPPEPKSRVINIDYCLERSEDIFGLVVSTFDLGTGGLCK